MDMKKQEINNDLQEVLAPYEKRWVALSADHKRVLADGETLATVRGKTAQKDAIFLRVLPATPYVPSAW